MVAERLTLLASVPEGRHGFRCVTEAARRVLTTFITSPWIFCGGVSHFIREMIMSKIHCVPHETGISFTYDGVQYVYTAEGFFHVGEGGLQSLDERDVPLLVSELAGHWKTFSLRVRVDNLVG